MSVPIREKVFTNRTLNGKKIKWVGFDMDYTLASYIRNPFQTLCYEITLKKMVELGYPEEILKIPYDPEFAERALVVDKERGNVLKLDSYNFVKQALHGFKFYSLNKKREVYHSVPIQYKERFESVDSLFHLPEVFLYCTLVNFKDHNPGSINREYSEIFEELRYNSDLAHKDESIKIHLMKNPEQYIHRDPYLADSLDWLQINGKKLFLLTNSYWEYTNRVMSFILPESETGKNWRSFFDAVVVGANKPDFFTGDQLFLEIDPITGWMKNTVFPEFNQNRVYQFGNVHLFEKQLQVDGYEILYIGDHIYSDIVSSKKRRNWRTALIVEELERTMKISPLVQNDLIRIEEKIARLEELEKTGNPNESQSLDMEIRKEVKEVEEKFHPLWGDPFRTGRSRSRFASQVIEFACLYSSKVSNFRHYAPNQLFRAPLSCLSHDIPLPIARPETPNIVSTDGEFTKE